MKTTFKKSAGVAALVWLTSQAPGVLAQPAPQISKGQQFYQKVCAKCHEAGIGPVITGRGFTAPVYTTIARSGLNAMPAFRISDIDDATLLELAQYLAAAPPKP